MLPVDIEQLFTRLAEDKRAVRASIVFLSMLIFITIWQLVVDIRAYGDTQVELHTSKRIPTRPPEYNIASAHLFGEYQSVKPLPNTKLNLKLEAIFYSEQQPKNSSALIAQSNQVAKIYYSGDRLSNGALVKEILPHTVIIQYANERQKLTLPIPELKFTPPLS